MTKKRIRWGAHVSHPHSLWIRLSPRAFQQSWPRRCKWSTSKLTPSLKHSWLRPSITRLSNRRYPHPMKEAMTSPQKWPPSLKSMIRLLPQEITKPCWEPTSRCWTKLGCKWIALITRIGNSISKRSKLLASITCFRIRNLRRLWSKGTYSKTSAYRRARGAITMISSKGGRLGSVWTQRSTLTCLCQ